MKVESLNGGRYRSSFFTLKTVSLLQSEFSFIIFCNITSPSSSPAFPIIMITRMVDMLWKMEEKSSTKGKEVKMRGEIHSHICEESWYVARWWTNEMNWWSLCELSLSGRMMAKIICKSDAEEACKWNRCKIENGIAKSISVNDYIDFFILPRIISSN